MKVVLNYFTYSAEKEWLTILVAIILPLLMPFLFAGLISVFNSSNGSPGIHNFDLENLPQAKEFPDYDDSFNYFAVSNKISRDLVDSIIAKNNLSCNVKEFESDAAARIYFAMSNIGEQYNKTDVAAAKEIFINDLVNNFRYSDPVGDTFIDHLQASYKEIYSLEEEDFEEESIDKVFLYINVFTSDEEILDTPQNITISFIYNTTILDNLLKKQLDKVSEKFGNLKLQPFWTGYALTLQKEIDEYFVKKYTNINYELNYQHLEEIPNEEMELSIQTIFEMSVLFAWTLMLIFATLLSTQNRGDAHVVLRRLGIKETTFWIWNFTYVTLIVGIAVLLQIFVWHFAGVLPFGAITLDFGVFIGIFITFQLSMTAGLFSVLLGMAKNTAVLTACVFAFILIMLPAMFHIMFFEGMTLFDPSLVPEWGTWTCMCLFPLFAVFGLMDSMTSSYGQDIRSMKFSNFKWKIDWTLIPIKYLFTDYELYSSTANFCAITDSKKGEMSETGECIFYEPIYGYVVLINFIQMILMPIGTMVIAHIKPEKAKRALPLGYFFHKKFWSGSEKPDFEFEEVVDVENVNMSFLKYEKIRSKESSNKIITRNIVFDNVNFSLMKDEVCALVGESSEGKSTMLSILAGELEPSKYNPREISEGNVNPPVCRLFGNIDLLDPYDAYNIKPYIGYCPEDFSNVWMDYSVFRNVEFSLQLRLLNTEETMDKEKEFINELLQSAGLGDTLVERRKAKELSGGMLRRLALCNALAGSQRFVLLDEITSGVDPLIKRQIWSLLRNIKGTILLTSHDMQEIGELTQNISILNGAKVIVNNVNEFELRRKYSKYDITLYKGSGLVTEDDYLELSRTLQCENQLKTMQRHVLEVSINQSLSGEQICHSCDELDAFLAGNGFDDYNISKCSLSDIYVELISGDAKKEEQAREIPEPRKSIINAMYRKAGYSDFRFTKFPLIFLLSLIAFICCVCTYLFYFLFNSMIKATTKMVAFKSRWVDLGARCFSGCIEGNQGDNYLEQINNCFYRRQPVFLFQKEPGSGYNAECKYYLSYLGLDQASNFKAFIGDGANNMPTSQSSYQFAIVEDKYQENLNHEVADNFIMPGDYTFAHQDFDYSLWYQQTGAYDPLEHSPGDGILPYVSAYKQYGLNENCGQYHYCIEQCSLTAQQFSQCKESFDDEKCLTGCQESYACEEDQQYEIHLLSSAKGYDSEISALKDYAGIKKIVNQNLQNLTDSGIINIVNQNNRYNHYSIANVQESREECIVNMAVPLPNIGRNMDYYSNNYNDVEMNSSQLYKCSGNYLASKNYYTLSNAATYLPHDSNLLYSDTLQQYPDRSHVRLFDIENQPATQIASAVIRKHLFEQSSDYRPWNFSYAYSSEEMPVFASSSIEKASAVSENDVLKSICGLHYAVVGMFPMMHAAVILGNEFEMQALNLYELHGVSPIKYILCELLYELSICFIPLIIDIIAVMLICPFLLFDSSGQIYNLLFFVLEAFLGMPTGMLIGCLFKKGKTSAMTSFFIILVILALQLLEFSSKAFTFIATFIVPNYMLIYESSELNKSLPIEWSFLSLSFGTSIIHLIICIIIMNSKLIKKKISLKPKGSGSEQSADEALHDTILDIIDVSHTYDNQNYVLKDISFEVPQNYVFSLLGANGSGKSTLMHCLAGIYRPTSGRAICGGRDLFEEITATELFSIVPELDILYPNLTVLDHLLIFNELNYREGFSVDKIVEIMSLEKYLDQPVFSLSGGIRRKLSFAIALCANPQIIALDEPSTGLGATTKKAVEEAVFALINTGKTVILTSHDMQEVEMISDRCVILKNGEIKAQGNVRDLRKQALENFELEIQLADNELDEFEKELKMQKIQYRHNVNQMCKYHAFGFGEEVKRQTIVQVLQYTKLDGKAWIFETEKLEHAFMEVMGEEEKK